MDDDYIHPDVGRITSRAKYKAGLWRTAGITAGALAVKEFQPIRYVVDGYLAEGATLLAGAPKIGKSWWALNVGMAIANGSPVFGSIPCDQGDVLYLALEDNQRRLKRRLKTMNMQPPNRLTFMTEWPALDAGCIEEMECWANEQDNPVLIIVDVLAKVRPATKDNTPLYEVDYRTLSGMQRLAGDRGISVLIVTHTRKMEAEDPFDTVSGTRGLTGAADTILVLKRDNGTGRTVLYGRGRDIEEIETAFEFQKDIGTWRIVGAAHEVAKTNERQAILNALRSSGKPLTAREVSDLGGGNYTAVRRTLTRMAAAAEVEKMGRGLYACPNGPNVSQPIDWDIETHGTGDILEVDDIDLGEP
jgi:hypothetical protein